MIQPLAIIKHWTGTNILVTAAAPETGLATLDIRHDDITLSVSLCLNESELLVLRDGADKALALIANSK
ncbi:MAG: hypothetical protein BroJett038_24450 [Chloroflexota bacterium]|nr:MAG: hypothetical protein BroJett038_24450 [Chloroflexota bacterium]